jgi:anti-sigma factor RsiW
MTACHEIQPRLSQFVDGGLADDTQAVVAHLDTCAACRGVVRDLERLRGAARELGPIRPPDHLWLEIAGQIRLADRPSTLQPGATPAHRHAVRQWIALAAALVVITLGAYVVARFPAGGSKTPATDTTGNAAGTSSVELVQQELAQAEQHYEKAITELAALAKSNETSLDPTVATTLSKNLTVIDQAIAESRAALSSDPTSQPARDSLFEGLRRKASVLEATVVLMNQMRQGNQEGAAKAAAGLGKKS